MRARSIKPGFFKNENLAKAGIEASYLFIGLWCLADRNGVLEDRPERIAVEVFPYNRKIDVEGLIVKLMQNGFIERFFDASNTNKALTNDIHQRYIKILNFEKHQRPHPNEPELYPVSGTLVTKESCNVITKNFLSRQEITNCPSSLNPSSLNPESLSTSPKAMDRDSFKKFWDLYPRKIGKGAAEKSWIKIDPRLESEIMSAVSKQRSCEQWKDPKFIPHPATWLNQRRWEDQLEATANGNDAQFAQKVIEDLRNGGMIL